MMFQVLAILTILVKEGLTKILENPRIMAALSVGTAASGYAMKDVMQIIMWSLASILSILGIIEAIQRQRKRFREKDKDK